MALFTFDTSTSPGKCSCDLNQFPIASPSADLFDKTAEALAQEISRAQMLVEKEEWDDRTRQKKKVWIVQPDKEANKPTQLRKFYDELCMWADKSRTTDAFERNLPFIKMMNAKVAYARGRGLVDDKFITWFSACLGQIKSPNEEGRLAFQNFRTLFEAFLGFYKVARPK